jgi:thiamine-phosphate pyrophosphorylase
LQTKNVPVRAVRDRYDELMIGYSAHSLTEMEEAEEEGADYVFISPVFVPLSKSSILSPHGPEVLREWTKSFKIPIFALGGITAGNVTLLKESGCRGVAGISLFLNEGWFTPDGMVL